MSFRNPWLYAAMVFSALLWLLIGLVLGAALGVSAQSEDVVQAAELANVDPVDLQGALLTVGEADAKRYLYSTGELARPGAPAQPDRKWLALAECEASGNWHAVSPGGRYMGGLQMDATFWRRYGGLAFASRPDLATREQQIAIAQRGLAVQGPGAWPICGRRVGLRA